MDAPRTQPHRAAHVNASPSTGGAAAPATARRLVRGPVGDIEVLVDEPARSPLGTAVIAHPHPVMGGNATHKVPHMLARACRDLGWRALRPNFRGVGATAGTHDHGRGETDDLVAVVDAVEREAPGGAIALIGFSFGAFVQVRVAVRLAQAGRAPAHVVLTGMPVGTVAGRAYDTDEVPKGTVLVHGEHDDRVPLPALLAWAGTHALPVVVIPGADHFFTGRLPMLRAAVQTALRVR